MKPVKKETAMNQLFRVALRYARRGWPVLRIHHPVPGGCACGNPECRRYSSLPPSGRAVDELTQEVGGLTQSAEAIAAKAKTDRIATLEAKAFDCIARGREVNIELGRLFNEIKDLLLEHGEWENYFAEKFAPRGIALRTAQLYMKMACEADAVSKNASSALFPLAIDPQAQAICDATEQAQAAVVMASEQPPEKSKSQSKKRVRLDGIYRLPLYMSGDEKDATDALLESRDWYHAEIEILAFLKQLYVKYGIVNDPATQEVQAIPETDPHPGEADDAKMGDAPDAAA
jgi:hypothetical protein